jgi:cytoskeletal protein CcmA (bactofilin family)
MSSEPFGLVSALTTNLYFNKANTNRLLVGTGKAEALKFSSYDGQNSLVDMVTLDSDANKVNLLVPTNIASSLVVKGTSASIDTEASSALNIGFSSSTINIGSENSVVNIKGTVNSVQTTNTEIKDALITLNKGGAAASASCSGLEFEEDGASTGYVKISLDRKAYDFKAPAQTTVTSIDDHGIQVFSDSTKTTTVMSVKELLGKVVFTTDGTQPVYLDLDHEAPCDLVTTLGQQSIQGVKTFVDNTVVSSVTNPSSLAGPAALAVSGGATIAKKLYVGQDAAFAAKVAISGDLSVTGATTLSGDMTLNGDLTLNNDLTVIGNAQFDSGLTAGAQSTFLNNRVTGTFESNGSSYFSNGVHQVDSVSIFNGSTTIDNTLNVTGQTTVGGEAQFSSDVIITGDLSMPASAITSNSLTANTVTASNTLTAGNVYGTGEFVSTVLIDGVKRSELKNVSTGMTQTKKNASDITVGDISLTDSTTAIKRYDSTGQLKSYLSVNDSTVELKSTGVNIIGATTLSDTLSVAENATFTKKVSSATLDVSSASTLSGAVSMGSTLAVTGATTLSDTLSVAENANFTKKVSSATLDISSASTLSGAVSMGSTLAVTGATTLSDTLSVAENATFTKKVSSATLDVSSASTLSGAVSMGSSLSVTGALTASSASTLSGAVSMGSTLAVTGATTLSDTLSVAEDATFTKKVSSATLDVSSASTLSGAVSMGSTLAVTGALTASSASTLSGAVSMGSTLSVTGDVNMNSSLIVQQGISTNGNVHVYGGAQFHSNTVTYGNSSVNGTLSVNQNTVLASNLTVAQSTTLSGALTVENDATITGAISGQSLLVSQDSELQGDLHLSGDATVDGKAVINSDLVFKGPKFEGGVFQATGSEQNNAGIWCKDKSYKDSQKKGLFVTETDGIRIVDQTTGSVVISCTSTSNQAEGQIGIDQGKVAVRHYYNTVDDSSAGNTTSGVLCIDNTKNVFNRYDKNAKLRSQLLQDDSTHAVYKFDSYGNLKGGLTLEDEKSLLVRATGAVLNSKVELNNDGTLKAVAQNQIEVTAPLVTISGVTTVSGEATFACPATFQSSTVFDDDVTLSDSSKTFTVAGSVVLGGKVNLSSTLNPGNMTDTANASFRCAGGAIIEKDLYAKGIVYNPTTQLMAISSDKRVKEQIVDADLDHCLKSINEIKLRNFNYTSAYAEQSGVKPEAVQLGVIADEFVLSHPESVIVKDEVTVGDDSFKDFKTVNLSRQIYELIGCVQRLTQRVQELESK